MWQELTRSGSLLTLGVMLLTLGIFLWRVRATFRRVFQHREDYARHLREAGRAEQAAATEEETQRLLRRLPLYGRLLVAAGILLTAIGWLRAR